MTAAGRTAAVVDVSYGGLRLELPDRGSLPKTFDVEVAGIGLHLEVEPVWSYPSNETGGTVCGAAIAGNTPPPPAPGATSSIACRPDFQYDDQGTTLTMSERPRKPS